MTTVQSIILTEHGGMQADVVLGLSPYILGTGSQLKVTLREA